MGTAHVRYSAEDRRQQILETATELFARQGYEGTTTRQIAHEAKVNEAIIFRHFPTKDDLYWAVVEQKCRENQGRRKIAEALREQGSYLEIFAKIAEEFLQRREEDSALGRLLLFTALENHRLSHRFFRTHIAEVYEEIGTYIRQQIEAGEFRPVHPQLAARGFLGMLVYHFMIQELFGGKKLHDVRHSEVAEQFADIWLNGVLPRPTEEREKHSATQNTNLVGRDSPSARPHKPEK
jgi:AcrR family transcriptional regulator